MSLEIARKRVEKFLTDEHKNLDTHGLKISDVVLVLIEELKKHRQDLLQLDNDIEEINNEKD